MTSGVAEEAAASEATAGGRAAWLAELQKRVPDRNVWRIYLTTFVLGLAYGLAISVIAIFLDRHGFGKPAIGRLAACFAGGIVCFSLPAGALVRRFSAKAVLCASLFGYALSVSAFPFLRSFAAIGLVRFCDGACSVGVWVSSESILLARADRHNKAFVTSLYAIALAFGYVVGPLVARAFTAFFPLELAFVVSGALAASAALFVKFRLEADTPGLCESHSPAPGSPHSDASHTLGAAAAAVASGSAPVSAARAASPLLARIKTSCFGTFAYGYFQASVVLFLPLYLMEEKHVPAARTIVIPAFFAAGMLLFSNWFGRLGDRHGHLLLMRLLGALGTLTVLGFVWLDSYASMCACVFVAGATLASISPVSLALQGVVADPTEYGRATASYNAFYALGMLLGPPLSSAIFAARGGAAMLLHLAALWASFVLVSYLFRYDDPAYRRV